MTLKEILKELNSLQVAEAAQAISSPEAAFLYCKDMIDQEQETFRVMYLNGAHVITGHTDISLGTLNRAIVHPRDVFREAIRNNASAIICAHNHPSGNRTPSPEDNELTTRITNAGELLGVTMLDHIIIGHGYYSYREDDKL